MPAVEGRGAERLTHRLTGRPEVATAHAMHGEWGLVAQLGTDTLKALDRVPTEIGREEGVVASETSLLPRTHPPRC